MFPWATLPDAKAAIKILTMLDLRGSSQAFICVTDGKVHNVNAMDVMSAEPGAIYVSEINPYAREEYSEMPDPTAQLNSLGF